MMKFSEHLRQHQAPQWSSQYIDYEGIKDFLYEIFGRAPATDQTNGQQLREDYLRESDLDVFQVN